MDDLDLLLSLVENPTRRRILESLAKEPSYPLRLSKELGVSQQAVMKNLALMEQNGLISSRKEDSDMGPKRTVYVPVTGFTLMVEMHCGTFSAKILEPVNGPIVPGMTPEQASERLKEIKERIEEIDRERAELMSEADILTEALARIGEQDDRRDQYDQ